jgi:hypothetical protein
MIDHLSDMCVHESGQCKSPSSEYVHGPFKDLDCEHRPVFLPNIQKP